MTDQLLEAPVQDSTVIDEDIDGVKSGGGKPPVEQPDKKEAPRKTETARDSLEAEAKKIEAKGAPREDEDEEGDQEKPVAKDVKAEKPESKESAPKADANEPEAKTPKPSEGRKIIEAPARFLPRAKELWQNVPHPVREEWARTEQEREQEVSQYRESHQFRQELKPYEDMARANNTTVKQALENYIDIERKFSEDPAQGFRQLLQNTGMTPTQAIGHVLRAFNATPQQLIEHIQREPHAYTSLAQPQRANQAPQQQPQISPEVAMLQKQVADMRAEQVASAVIAPFASDYPEYYQHEGQIAKVLESGIIEQIHGNGLSPRDKLEAALFMVAPHVKKGSVSQANNSNESVQGDSQSDAPAVDLRGGKSVKSSVGGVTEVVEPDRKMSMRDMLEEEARKLSRRA